MFTTPELTASPSVGAATSELVLEQAAIIMKLTSKIRLKMINLFLFT